MILFDPVQKYFYSTLLSINNIIGVFGTRSLGDGRHMDKIFNAFNQLELSYKKLVILEQIHSANVKFYESENQTSLDKIPETDGVVTKETDTILTVITADCLPLIFADKNNGLIGVSHNGWRGSVKRLGQKMVAEFVHNGSRPEDIMVAIGPGIGSCCYSIDEDRYISIVSELNGYSDQIFRMHHGVRYLNLLLFNYLMLVKSGISEDHIDFFPFCTKCDSERFFSFRRENKTEYGEMFTFVENKS